MGTIFASKPFNNASLCFSKYSWKDYCNIFFSCLLETSNISPNERNAALYFPDISIAEITTNYKRITDCVGILNKEGVNSHLLSLTKLCN